MNPTTQNDPEIGKDHENDPGAKVAELVELCRSAGRPDVDLAKISDWILNLTAAMDLAARVAADGPKVAQVPTVDSLLICPVATAARYFADGLKTGISSMLLAIVSGDLRGLEMAASGWPVAVETTKDEWIGAEAEAELMAAQTAGMEV